MRTFSLPQELFILQPIIQMSLQIIQISKKNTLNPHSYKPPKLSLNEKSSLVFKILIKILSDWDKNLTRLILFIIRWAKILMYKFSKESSQTLSKIDLKPRTTTFLIMKSSLSSSFKLLMSRNRVIIQVWWRKWRRIISFSKMTEWLISSWIKIKRN